MKKALARGERIIGICLRGFSDLLTREPYPEVRLGKEFAELVRFYGLGGVFHTDELPEYGISQLEVDAVRSAVQASELDAALLLAGQRELVSEAAEAVAKRARDAAKGVPAETRAPTAEGKTRFLRPRPGPARMYPETDIPPIPISPTLITELRKRVPKSRL